MRLEIKAALCVVVWVVGACGSDNSTGCADEDRTGRLAFSIYGEDFIEEKIPSGEFSDGWEVHFERFIVHLASVTALREGCDAPGLEDRSGWVFDLTEKSEGAGQHVVDLPAAVGIHRRVDYEIGPALSSSLGGNASVEDRDAMVAGGYSVLVEGIASRAGASSKHFRWAFTRATRYLRCESAALVEAEKAGVAELTIHGDHLFYDDLVSPEPNISFDLMASADVDNDDEITLAELDLMSVIGLSRYGVGNNTDVESLGQFVTHLVSTLGHIDGEGHCEASELL